MKIVETPFFESKNVSLIKGNSLEILKQIEDCSIDMIFSDPPYFLSSGGITCKNGKMVSVNKGDWDKSESYKDTEIFNEIWLKESQRILKTDGCIWISGTHHNIFSIGNQMKLLGYKILNLVTWEKPNPPPNLSCRYFTHSTEQIIWGSKNDKSKHKFNYELMKKKNEGKQMKDVWRLTSPSKLEKSHGKHPTQKPEKLLERIILSSTDENDLVLDPFNGSGTTGVVSTKLNRRYIGIELEKDYLEITVKRLRDEENIFTLSDVKENKVTELT